MGFLVEGDGLLLGSMADFCFAQQGVREADVGVELNTTGRGCGVGALTCQVVGKCIGCKVGEVWLGSSRSAVCLMSMRCC